MNDRGYNNIFKDIIKDNWSEFKKVYPKYGFITYMDISGVPVKNLD